jgi:hypothetical protein
MLDFLDLLLDWKRLVALGTDVTIYFIMGLMATLLFMIRLAISLFAGSDPDFDIDADIGDAGSGFTFFSTLSILAFFMGAGWMGVACRVDWHLSGLPSAAIASGFGFGMMLLASGLMYLTRRLNRTVRYDPSTAVGRTGPRRERVAVRSRYPFQGGARSWPPSAMERRSMRSPMSWSSTLRTTKPWSLNRRAEPD